MDIQAAINTINSVVFIKEKVLRLCFSTILCRGHLLIEDVPGVGKTTLAKSLARIFGLDTKRIQFTNDLLPADITGYNYIDTKTGDHIFRPGAVFTNVLLADEINRASPRTQSALLEIMEERTISIEGKYYDASDPFFIIATQNPYEHSGTFPLPQSQLDRFSCKITMGYPNSVDEQSLLSGKNKSLDTIKQRINKKELLDMMNEVQNVYVDDKIISYILKLTNATRNHDEVSLGISPRGSILLKNMSRAIAYIDGRDFVTSDDVSTILPNCVTHRMVMHSDARNAEEILKTLLTEIGIP